MLNRVARSWDVIGGENSKSEARKTKQMRMTKIRMTEIGLGNMNYAITASLFGQFVAVPRNIVRTCRAVMIMSCIVALAFLQSPASLEGAGAEQASSDATTSLHLVPWPPALSTWKEVGWYFVEAPRLRWRMLRCSL